MSVQSLNMAMKGVLAWIMGWQVVPSSLIAVLALQLIMAGAVAVEAGTDDRQALHQLERLRTAYANGDLTAGDLGPRHGSLLRRLSAHEDPAVRARVAHFSGLVLRESGRDQAAVEAWRAAAAEVTPVHGAAWADLQIALGRWELEQERHYEALVLLEPVIQRLGESDQAIEAAFWCGRVHLEADDRPHAVNALRWARTQAARLHSDPAAVFPFWNQLQSDWRRATRTTENADRLFSQAERLRARQSWTPARERYQRLLETYPDSEPVAESRWAIGACLLGAGEIQEAAQHWRAMADDDPLAAFRGQALVSLGDLYLEQRFRLDDAHRVYREARDRLRRLERLDAPLDSVWQRAAYDLHLRFGLVAFIRNDRDAALENFAAARQHEPPRQPVLTGLEPMPTPVERLIEHLQSGRDLTPRSVLSLDQREHQAAALMCFLGDFYLLSQQPQRARRLFARVADDDTVAAHTLHRAYASFRLAEAYYEGEDFARFYRQLKHYLKHHSDAPWTADVLMRKGVAEYSRHKKPEAALESFRQVAEHHPQHELAPASLWYMATILRWEEHDEAALRAYRLLNQRYPQNGFRPVIESEFIPQLEARLSKRR